MMVMKPEESAAVQALALHALASVAMAYSIAPKFVADSGDEADNMIDDAGAHLIRAANAVDDAEDIIGRHRR